MDLRDCPGRVHHPYVIARSSSNRIFRPLAIGLLAANVLLGAIAFKLGRPSNDSLNESSCERKLGENIRGLIRSLESKRITVYSFDVCTKDPRVFDEVHYISSDDKKPLSDLFKRLGKVQPMDVECSSNYQTPKKDNSGSCYSILSVQFNEGIRRVSYEIRENTN